MKHHKWVTGTFRWHLSAPFVVGQDQAGRAGQLRVQRLVREGALASATGIVVPGIRVRWVRGAT